MKFIIVGRHATGKIEVINSLENYGIRVGREFCTSQNPDEHMYIDPKYEYYTDKEVVGLFENNAYLYMSGTDELNIRDSEKITRGISQYSFDNCEVIAFQPAQLIGLNKSCLRKERIIVVWLDNTLNQRINRHALEKRTYSFMDIEELECSYDQEFVSTVYSISDGNLIYFNNEDPQRVAMIIRVMVEHPEYIDDFIKTYN